MLKLIVIRTSIQAENHPKELGYIGRLIIPFLARVEKTFFIAALFGEVCNISTRITETGTITSRRSKEYSNDYF